LDSSHRFFELKTKSIELESSFLCSETADFTHIIISHLSLQIIVYYRASGRTHERYSWCLAERDLWQRSRIIDQCSGFTIRLLPRGATNYAREHAHKYDFCLWSFLFDRWSPMASPGAETHFGERVDWNAAGEHSGLTHSGYADFNEPVSKFRQTKHTYSNGFN